MTRRPARSAALSRLLFTAALPILAAACAGPDWSKPNTPEREARADLSDCRREAEADILPRSDTYTNDIGPGVGPGSGLPNPIESAGQARAERSVGKVVAACMQAKGYSRGAAAPKK